MSHCLAKPKAFAGSISSHVMVTVMVSHCRPTAGRRPQHGFSAAGLPFPTLPPPSFQATVPHLRASTSRPSPFSRHPLGGPSGPPVFSHSVHVLSCTLTANFPLEVKTRVSFPCQGCKNFSHCFELFHWHVCGLISDPSL